MAARPEPETEIIRSERVFTIASTLCDLGRIQ